DHLGVVPLHVVLDSPPAMKKPLAREAPWGTDAASPRWLPRLRKKLHHLQSMVPPVIDLFPASARIEDGELTLGGLRASALAEEFGTPLVVYCEDTLRGQARALLGATGGRVAYGTKAFPNVALMRLLGAEGIGADVASAGELAFARAAGIAGDQLI